MDKWLFRIAGIFVAFVLLAHELLGSPMVLPPLHDAGVPAQVLWLHHFSWHVGSVAMLGMIFLFILGARQAEDLSMVCVATGMSIGFAVLGIGLAVLASHSLWDTPAPYAWTVTSALGIAGIGVRLKVRGR